MTSSALLNEQRLAGGMLLDHKTPASKTYRFCNPAILHFGEPEREYQAARSEAVLFDVSDRAQIEVTGKDARNFLNNFCTNDIHRLGTGQGCEAFVTNVKGRILAHIFVFVTDGSVWIETNRHVEETLLAHFDRYLITEDVQLHSRTGQFGELFVTGPDSAEKLSSLNIPVNTLGLCEHAIIDRGDGSLVIRRLDLLYEQWIKTYAGDEFGQLCARLESLLDEIASNSLAVCDAYRYAMQCELDFFSAPLENFQ